MQSLVQSISKSIWFSASNNIGDQETTLHQVILEKNSQEKDLNKLINNNLTKTGNISEKLQENETAETDQSETDSVSKTFVACIILGFFILSIY